MYFEYSFLVILIFCKWIKQFVQNQEIDLAMENDPDSTKQTQEIIFSR